jgi:hypothetical protein
VLVIARLAPSGVVRVIIDDTPGRTAKRMSPLCDLLLGANDFLSQPQPLLTCVNLCALTWPLWPSASLPLSPLAGDLGEAARPQRVARGRTGWGHPHQDPLVISAQLAPTPSENRCARASRHSTACWRSHRSDTSARR